MKHVIKIYLALVLMVPCIAQSQARSGDQHYDDLSYIKARKSYLKASDNGVKSIELLKKLGDSYYFNADYKSAANWYGQLYQTDKNLESEYIYRYALSLKSDEKYGASDKIMEAFYKSKGEDYRANLFINERNYLEEIELQSGRFELSNVDFNSELSDFAPSFYQGGIIYASNRKNRGVSKRTHGWNNQPFLDLYNLTSTGPSKFNSKINSIYHESTAVFSKDSLTMYFTRNNYSKDDYKQDKEGTNRLKLYRAKRNVKQSDEWNIEELPFNSDEYSVAHPALSPDEKTLYFASDMPGTKGMSDLFKVSVNNNSFGEIINLGNKINSEGRETFPFVSKDNKLYFASDGHLGLGGLDVFVSELENDEAGEAFNLGKPINGPNDDFTFIVNSTTGLGYFASNRPGGKGDDDIYSFKTVKPIITKCQQSIEGFVLDKESDDPIANATVFLLDENNKVLDEKTSKVNGSFSFKLDCAKTYSIRSSIEKYSTEEKVFNTSNKTGFIERSIFLKKENNKAVVPQGVDVAPLLGVNIIYFDQNRDHIRRDAEVELRKIIDFMNVYKDIKIDVRSHTDSRQSGAYNLGLSNRRAQSTVDYLVNVGGISRSRLTYHGYGETQLRNRCSDGVSCSESEHQLNRRSEFVTSN